jgi:hypothetical protein
MRADAPVPREIPSHDATEAARLGPRPDADGDVGRGAVVTISALERGKAAFAALKPLIVWEAQPYDKFFERHDWETTVTREDACSLDEEEIDASIYTPGNHGSWGWSVSFDTGEFRDSVVTAFLVGSVNTREQAVAAAFAVIEHALVIPEGGVDTDAALAAAVEAVGEENAISFGH